METRPELECLAEPLRAAILLDPLRLKILALAAQPASATEIAGRLRLPRQKVNYHVRQLARARFLRRAGRHRKRNMIEQRYQAAAQAWVLAPEILGPLGAHARRVEDTYSAAYLVSLAARMQSELARLFGRAAGQGKRLSTLSVSSDVRFESAGQRARFTEALRAALVDLIGKHTSPAAGRPYRLVVGCYPQPATQENAPRCEPRPTLSRSGKPGPTPRSSPAGSPTRPSARPSPARPSPGCSASSATSSRSRGWRRSRGSGWC